MSDPTTRRLLQLFATLLDYPGPDLPNAADECLALLEGEAVFALGNFRQFVAGHPAARVEEIYTGVFELNPVYYPYVGYHLFGETYKRSIFLLGLQERYAAHGFTFGTELADHLVVMLRFVAACEDATCANEIVQDALVPAVEKMIAQKAEEDSAIEGAAAYRQLLCALQRALTTYVGTQKQAAMASLA